jgi:hypothetical protein
LFKFYERAETLRLLLPKTKEISMSGQYHKNPMTKILSLVGIATASAFLALPGVAQFTPNTESTGTDGQLLAQGMPGNERIAFVEATKGMLLPGEAIIVPEGE